MDDHSRSPTGRSQALTVPPSPAPAVAAALTEAGRAALARNASAPATLRTYRSDWAHYAA